MSAPTHRIRLSATGGLLALTVLLGLLALSPARAAASGTGAITGTYWIESPVAPVFCYGGAAAYNSDGLQVASRNFGPGTGVHDSYLFGGLETGDYRVGFEFHCMGELDFGLRFDDSGYYNGSSTLEEATPVRVIDGSTRTGINRVHGGGASISGTVRDDSGKPLGGICVLTYDFEGRLGVTGNTGTDGSYKLRHLLPGDFRLEFTECLNEDSPVIPEFYGDKSTLDDSPPVTVSSVGEKITGVDAQLTVKKVTPPPDPPGARALIDKVAVKGPARVRKGNKATFRVGITNSGNAAATGVKLEVEGRGVGFGTSVGKIPAGEKETVKVWLKPTRPGKGMLRFRVTSSNAGAVTVNRAITVRRKNK